MWIRTLGFKQVISVSQNLNPEFFTNGSECALFDDRQYGASGVECGLRYLFHIIRTLKK
jgi:hypothetical protein